MSAPPTTRWTQFITPLGGLIAFSGFFMPWLTSGSPELKLNHTRSGFQFFVSSIHLAPRSTFYFVVFVASIVIIGLSLYMVIRRTPWKSRTSVLISSGIGLSILLTEKLKYIRVTETVASANYSIEFGVWVTVFGFAVAAIGVLLIKTPEGYEHPKVSVETDRLWFVVHGGGIVAFFCFFMPWKEIGTMDHVRL